MVVMLLPLQLALQPKLAKLFLPLQLSQLWQLMYLCLLFVILLNLLMVCPDMTAEGCKHMVGDPHAMPGVPIACCHRLCNVALHCAQLQCTLTSYGIHTDVLHHTHTHITCHVD